MPALTIGASYGDALIAARGVGLVAPDAQWNEGAQVLQPDPAVAPLHADRYALFRRLYRDTLEETHALARLQEDAAAG